MQRRYAPLKSSASAVTWGSITGTLSAQTDLQSALDAKAATSHTHLIADITDFTDNSTNWDTAYSWGDHSLAGYLTSVANQDIYAGLTFPSNSYLDFDDDSVVTNSTVLASIGSMSFVLDTNNNGSSDFFRWYRDNADLTLATQLMELNNSGNLTVTGTVTGSNLNVSNWDSAYTYSQVGHLPLTGGTLTGVTVIYATTGASTLDLRPNATNGNAYIDFLNSSGSRIGYFGFTGDSGPINCSTSMQVTGDFTVSRATSRLIADFSSTNAAGPEVRLSGPTTSWRIGSAGSSNVTGPSALGDLFFYDGTGASMVASLDTSGNFEAIGNVVGGGTNTNPGANKSNLTTNMLHIDGKEAIDGVDTWLRLNQNNAFTNGTYTPYNLRVDSSIYLGATVNFTNVSNSYFQFNAASGYLRIGPQNTSYCHFYTDRTKYYFDQPVHLAGGATYYNLGAFYYNGSSSYASGKVTFSTSAATGGASGDVWYQYV